MGDQIDITTATITTMICPGTHRSLEDAFLSVITIASNYETQDDELYMRKPDDSTNATFTELQVQSIESTSWVLNAYNDGSVFSRIKFRVLRSPLNSGLMAI